MQDIAHEQTIIDQFTRWAKPFAELPMHAEAEAMATTLAVCVPDRAEQVLVVAWTPAAA